MVGKQAAFGSFLTNCQQSFQINGERQRRVEEKGERSNFSNEGRKVSWTWSGSFLSSSVVVGKTGNWNGGYKSGARRNSATQNVTHLIKLGFWRFPKKGNNNLNWSVMDSEAIFSPTFKAKTLRNDSRFPETQRGFGSTSISETETASLLNERRRGCIHFVEILEFVCPI